MTQKLKIALASQSEIKLSAVKQAFPDADVYAFDAKSGVNEQPLNDETIDGAIHRIMSMLSLNFKKEGRQPQECDLLVSIESGLFENEEGAAIDRAVIVFKEMQQNKKHFVYLHDEPRHFMHILPSQLKRIKDWNYNKTVGDILHDEGLVADPKNPHKNMCGISREKILICALQRAWEAYSTV